MGFPVALEQTIKLEKPNEQDHASCCSFRSSHRRDSSSSRGRFENLGPEVERHLGDIGVSKTDVKKISIFPRRRTGNATSIITGCNATISFHNCGGHLAINMNSVGDVQDVYNRSGCNIPGVASY